MSMQTTPLGNLCTILTGKLDVNAHNPNGVYPFFTCAKENYAIDTYAFDGESVLIAGNGDLNAKYYVGKFNAYQRTYVLQNFLFNGRYVFWIITHNLDLLRLGARGSTIKYIRLGDLQNMEIPLCSLLKQQIIVDEIEKQLSRLDNGLQSLENIETDLKSYKASILKSAVEGKLTEERRKENKNIEPASKLLDKILVEKKHKREQENPGKKYKEPQKINTEGLVNLPEGRCRVNIDQISPKITDGEHFKPRFIDSGMPFLSAKDVLENGESFDDAKYVSISDGEKSRNRCNPDQGDILMVSRGATIGRCCLVSSDIKFSLLGSVILIKKNPLIDFNYLLYYLKSPYTHKLLYGLSGATAQQAIYLRDIQKVNIPIPPFKEQQTIVQEMEEKISVVDNILDTVEANIKRAKQLKQSILHQAFTGQLVPMKDDDKGVMELLAEIEKTKTMLVGQKKNKKVKQK